MRYGKPNRHYRWHISVGPGLISIWIFEHVLAFDASVNVNDVRNAPSRKVGTTNAEQSRAAHYTDAGATGVVLVRN